MTKEQIKQEALKRERDTRPSYCSDPAYRGVNSAYGLGFVDGAEWAFRHKDKCSPFILVSNMLPGVDSNGKCPNRVQVLIDGEKKPVDAFFSCAGFFSNPSYYSEYQLDNVIAWRYIRIPL